MNNIKLRKDIKELFASLGITEMSKEEIVKRGRKKLLEIRNNRPKPLLRVLFERRRRRAVKQD